MSLSGKVALVTGGLSGIGEAIASRMRDEGAIVISADIATEVTALTNETVAPLRMDVSNPESVRLAIGLVLDRYGRIDCLINSAGIAKAVPFLETSLQDFDQMVSVNLRGSFLVGQLAAMAMTQTGGGAIVNIASVSGIKANIDRSAYGASKAGLILLSCVMAVELAGYGIRVNVIAPGPIRTKMTDKMHTEQARKQWCEATPMHRYGTPEEIAGAAVFLCSKDAQYITGHVMVVDGGFVPAGLTQPSPLGSARHEPTESQ
jgi:NAD(P)-dependent dehydrogenase (short-subunit alcohol dehydrogenase family)